jgi:hypothetical protein
MINPPAKDQVGIFNPFIDPPSPQIYGVNAVADENAMLAYSHLHYWAFNEGSLPGGLLRTWPYNLATVEMPLI